MGAPGDDGDGKETEQLLGGRPPDGAAKHTGCDSPQKSQRWLLGAMVLVAACFCFLFAGYSTLEILGTTFHGDLGCEPPGSP
jgi:hypothetical protein